MLQLSSLTPRMSWQNDVMMDSNDSTRGVFLAAVAGHVVCRQESILLGQVSHSCKIHSQSLAENTDRSPPVIASLCTSLGLSLLGRDVPDPPVHTSTDISRNHNGKPSTQTINRQTMNRRTRMVQNSCPCLSSTGLRSTNSTALMKGWKRAHTDTRFQGCPTASHFNVRRGTQRNNAAPKTRSGSPQPAASRLAPSQHVTKSDQCRQSPSSADNRGVARDGMPASRSQSPEGCQGSPSRTPANEKLYISSNEYLHCESGACIFGVRSPPKVRVNQDDESYLSRSTLASTFGREH